MIRETDTLVLGGGTAGAVVAGLLAERSDERVLVAEAGPDFGPRGDPRWPADALDAAHIATGGDWGHSSEDSLASRTLPFERARMIGGCSSHNGCAAVWGSRLDYDAWAGLCEEPAWGADAIAPLFAAASRRLRVRTYTDGELTPFHAAMLAAFEAAGIPRRDDLDDLDCGVGGGPSPVNVVDGVRWNTAFAYLDPVRERASLTVVGGALADRLLIEHGRVVGARLVVGGERVDVRAQRTVLCAGSYGSPAILLRSGVGDPDELRVLGIEPLHALPGVGRNLHDHPAAELVYGGSRELERLTGAFAARRFAPVEQSIAKARSSLAAGPFDLHVYPVGGQTPDGAGFDWRIPVACMEPRSRGRLRLRSAEPEALPLLDHGFLTDDAGHDLAALAEGLQLVREIAAQPPLRDLLGAELGPSAGAADAQALRRFVRSEFVHYYHPVGTCRMGAATDPDAVVDGRGALLGLDGAWIADCSIMPVVPRANTNIPAVVVGERVARTLLGGDR